MHARALHVQGSCSKRHEGYSHILSPPHPPTPCALYVQGSCSRCHKDYWQYLVSGFVSLQAAIEAAAAAGQAPPTSLQGQDAADRAAFSVGGGTGTGSVSRRRQVLQEAGGGSGVGVRGGHAVGRGDGGGSQQPGREEGSRAHHPQARRSRHQRHHSHLQHQPRQGLQPGSSSGSRPAGQMPLDDRYSLYGVLFPRLSFQVCVGRTHTRARARAGAGDRRVAGLHGCNTQPGVSMHVRPQAR